MNTTSQSFYKIDIRLRLAVYFLMGLSGYVFTLLNLVGLRESFFFFIMCFVITYKLEKAASGDNFYKQMPFIYTVVSFIYIYLGGFWYIFTRDLLPITSVDFSVSTINKVFLITNVAIQSIWIGSTFGGNKSFRIERVFIRQKIPFPNLMLLIFLSIGSMILSISLGSFGYTARSLDSVMENQEFAFYLNMGRELGLLGFISLVFFYSNNKKYRKYIYLTLLIFIFFGILFGSKSASLYFILSFFISRYFLGQKVSLKRSLIVLSVSFVLVYSIIEPFRQYYVYGGGANMSLTSITDLSKAFKTAFSNSEKSDQFSVIVRTIDRLTYVVPAASAVEYAEDYNHYVPDDYRLSHLFAAPAYALVPRFLWQSKPKLLFGRWFSNDVLGWSSLNSVGITPQAYVYMTGGYLQIVLIFLFYGFCERLIFNTLYISNRAVPLYIFYYMRLGGLDDVAWAYVSGAIKFLILYGILFYLAKRLRFKIN